MHLCIVDIVDCRKTTLEKLLQKVQSEDEFKDEAERLAVFRELLKPILRSLSDGLEKCRDTAVRIIQTYVVHSLSILNI